MPPSKKTKDTKNQSEGNIPSSKRRAGRSKVEATVQPDLTPGTTRFMQRYLGNRAVARIMAQRDGVDQLEYPGPRTENGVKQRGGSELSSSPTQRAAPSSSATGNIGDATDLDGESMYGWDRTITANDVATVVNGVIPTMSSEEEMPRIVIFSGTHGNTAGHLINDATSRGFVAEDQATANAVTAANPGVQVELIAALPTKIVTDGTRGWHTCTLCAVEMPKVEWKGKMVDVPGHGHYLVRYDNAVYMAPALLLHYILDHHYRPPQIFIDAVLNGKFLATDDLEVKQIG